MHQNASIQSVNTIKQHVLSTLPSQCSLFALLLMVSGFSIAAQPTPDAGTLLQQTIPTLPATPSPNETGIAPEKDAGIADTTSFMVNKIHFKGNTLVGTEVLHAMVKHIEGTEITLTELQEHVYLISDYYHQAGYPFARAIIPQQEITNGEVLIEVIEAQYGEIKLNNQSKVRDGLLHDTLSTLKPGEPIAQKALDRALLLLSDIPGTGISTRIEAGKAAATSDLLVEANHTERLIGRVTVDDYGNTFINRQRAGASLYLLNPAKHGDVLSVNLLTTGKRMQYGQLAYDFLLNGHGTHLGASYSALHYELGEDLAKLGVNGKTETMNAYVKHPFIRAKQYNLYGQIAYNHNALEDKVDVIQSENKRTVESVSLVLNGDWRDQLISSAVSSWRVSYTQGDVDIKDATTETIDALTADTQGHFSKLDLNVNRLQRITDRTSLWLSLTAQVTDENLDSSQKMVFGGPFSVRAYDTGAISGDNGYLATVEIRHLLSQQYGTWQAVAFADSGRVEVNADSWVGLTGKNKATLNGAGLGLNWQKNKLAAKVNVATSVGSSSSLTEDSDKTIAWAEFSIGF